MGGGMAVVDRAPALQAQDQIQTTILPEKNRKKKKEKGIINTFTFQVTK
jgi:hypothetical protein